MSDERNYELAGAAAKRMAAPRLPFGPPKPKTYRPTIGLIGCGGITEHHLKAYKKDRYRVAAFCDVSRAAAEKRRDDFYPKASVYTDYRELLARSDVDVVDIATHAEGRPEIIRAALNAGKHVLSQKPFVLDLNEGKKLAQLAKRKGLKTAVNQNGRWSPYFRYMRQIVKSGRIGQINSMVCDLCWDHSWTQGTPFEKVQHLILFDLGIHWFDAVAYFFEGRKVKRVYASEVKSNHQTMKPPLQANVVIEYANGLAALNFSGHAPYGSLETNTITGTEGTVRSAGELCGATEVEWFSAKGVAKKSVTGHWFLEGFRGAMGELCCAIEEDREPGNNFTNNLNSLSLCYAAVASAESGEAVVPGTIKRMET